MECDVCSRAPEEKLDFHCAACARNAAYLPRLEYARVLLEKSSLSNKVKEAVAAQDQKPHGIADPPNTPETDHRVWMTELTFLQSNETKKCIGAIRLDQDHVKQESLDLRKQIEELKLKNAEKRKTLETIHNTIPGRRHVHQASIASTSVKASSSLLKLQQKSMENRAKLCREAAILMRLRQRRRHRDTLQREQYSIAGLTLPDLREISNLRCTDLTAVLGTVAHLTVVVAFYLGIRLPAEITTPFNDYPLPTIFTPAGSYRKQKLEFPGSGPSTSTISSPSASRHDQGASLKPRPLYIGLSTNRDERVFNFQKRDEQAFRYFTEGIALLAWDVAWLCRTQGFTAGTNSWENICNMGRNFHQLLVANPQVASMKRFKSDQAPSKRPSPSKTSSSPLQEGRKDVFGRLGQYSDISAVTQSVKVAQRDLLTYWDFISWHKVAIPLRKTLLTEIASAEWELLLDEEWDDGGEQFDEAIMIKGRNLDTQQYDDARSIMTTKTQQDEDMQSLGRVPGTSGWTKLKSREKPS